jgi:hypothetical protein
MTKKGVRVVVTGAQRRTIDMDVMTQIVIALGRELALREPGRTKTWKPGATTTDTGARP